jgi:hypothetical protein
VKKGSDTLEKKQAEIVSNYLDQCNDTTTTTYEIHKLSTPDDMLLQFHQWANRKPIIAAYEVSRLGHDSYFFLFIDWHRNNNYYLVIYAHDKSTTIAELNRTIEEEGVTSLSWTYNPLKRDGKNDIRKSYFMQTFGNKTMTIPLPTSTEEIEPFLDQIFKLCHNRIRADRIVEVFDIE